MSDNENVKIGLEVDPGASKSNLERGIVAPLKEVDAAGKQTAQSVTADLRQIEEATAGAAGAEGKLVAATNQVTAAVEAETGALERVAAVAEEASQGVAASAEQEASALEAVGASAEASAEGVTNAADGITTALDEIAPAAAEAATGVATIGETATTASEEATTAFDETTTALEETAAAAQEIGPTISSGFAEVADQAQLVQDAVDKFYQRLADGLAPGRGALRQISAQYSLLGEQIAEASGLTEEEAAAAQANYARIGAAIQGVIAKQRQFNLELKSTQFATRESGEQFALLGLAAEQVGKHFGETGAEIGQTAGELGLFAAIIPRLTIMLKGLGPVLTAPFEAGVGSIAGIIVAFLAGAKAGEVFSATNEQNAESIENLVKWLKELVTGGGEVGAFLGRMQAGMQVFTSDVILAGEAIVEFFQAMSSGNLDAVKVALDHLRDSTKNFTQEVADAQRAQDKERLAAEHAADAHKEGGRAVHDFAGETHNATGEIDKAEKSTANLTATQKFHITTLQLGAVGLRLWNQALDAANGSEKTLNDVVQKLQPELDKLVENYHKAKAALDLQLDGIKKQIEEEKKLIETEADESRKIQQLVTDIGTEEAARKKLHATTQGEIEDDAKLELAKNGTSEAIQKVAQRIAELTAEFDAEQPSIDAKIARLEALGKSTVDISAETKTYIDRIVDEKKAIDDLTQKNKALQQEEDALTATGQALTKAGYDRIQAIDHEISGNQIAIQQAKDKISADAQLLQAQQSETKGTIEITGANGRAIDSQHKLTQSTQDQTKAAKDAGTGLSELAKNVKLSSDKAEELSDKSKGIEVSVGKAGDASEKAGAKFHEAGTGLDEVAKSAHLTETSITIVGDAATKAADKSTAAAALFKKVVQEEQDDWKKSGILVEEHTKKIETLSATYKRMEHDATGSIQNLITMLQKLDDQTKKTAGGGSTAASPPTSAPSGPKQPASDSGGGSSGRS